MKRPSQNQPDVKVRIQQLWEEREQLLKDLENLKKNLPAEKPSRDKRP
jgi:hypothetical protein